MKKSKVILSSVVLAGALIFSSLTAFAMTPNELQNYVNDYKLNFISSDNKKLVQPDATWTEVSVNGVYYYISPAGVQEAEAHLSKVKADETQRKDIVNQLDGLNDLDLTPDLDSSMGSISGFLPAIRFILGLMVSIITVGMTLFSACDITYIAFPVVRQFFEGMKESGNSVAIDKSRSQKSGETKLRFISDEAEYAVKRAETIETGKNPLTIYLGKRIVSYIVLGVVLVILLTGNITIITDIAIKAVSGIIELIQKI